MLEGCRGIAQPKWNVFEREGPEGQVKVVYFLVFRGYIDLVVALIRIKTAVPSLYFKSIQHFIHEQHWNVVFLCPSIKLPVVHANSSSCHRLHQNNSFLSLGTTVIPTFIGTY